MENYILSNDQMYQMQTLLYSFIHFSCIYLYSFTLFIRFEHSFNVLRVSLKKQPESTFYHVNILRNASLKIPEHEQQIVYMLTPNKKARTFKYFACFSPKKIELAQHRVPKYNPDSICWKWVFFLLATQHIIIWILFQYLRSWALLYKSRCLYPATYQMRSKLYSWIK